MALTAEPRRPTSGPPGDDSEGASTGEQIPGSWGEVCRWVEWNFSCGPYVHTRPSHLAFEMAVLFSFDKHGKN